jgi:anti-sigma factor RsiW
MTNRTERGPDAHAGHDSLLIAAYAADDITTADRRIAEALIDSCTSCAQLADDLRLIAAATRALPAPARPHDFTLSPEQAARLRRTSWRSLANRLGWARGDLGRVLAAGLTTVGLAGLLFVAVPGQLGGSAASLPTTGAAVDQQGERSVASAPAAALPGASAGAAPSAAASHAPAATGSRNYGDQVYQASPSSAPEVGIAGDRGSAGQRSPGPYAGTLDSSSGPLGQQTESSPPNLLLVLSLVSLVLGVGLFAIRRLTGRAID